MRSEDKAGQDEPEQKLRPVQKRQLEYLLNLTAAATFALFFSFLL